MSFFGDLAYEFVSGVTLGLFGQAQKSLKTQKNIKKYSKPITRYQPRYFAPTHPPSRTQSSIYNNYTKEELERSMKNAEKFRNLTF